MGEKLEVIRRDFGDAARGVYWYEVGNWTFEEEDMNLAYIDEAIATWTRWREYTVEQLQKQIEGGELI